MINDVKAAITAKLNVVFPDCAVYDEYIQQYFKTPSFIVNIIEIDYQKRMSNKYDASKINALLSRAAARDLYDSRNMIYYRLFDETEEEILRKCVVFYAAISAKEINKTFDTSSIDTISPRKIKTDLYPVIKNKERFDLEATKKMVKEFIEDLMKLTKEEKEFLNRFEGGEYIPELLFEDKEIIGIKCIE